MDLEKLLEQQKALAKQIEEARNAERPAKIAEVKAIVELFNLTPRDVFGDIAVGVASQEFREKKKVKPKFKDPHSDATWSGRGKPPKWFMKLTEDEKKMSRIQEQEE